MSAIFASVTCGKGVGPPSPKLSVKGAEFALNSTHNFQEFQIRVCADGENTEGRLWLSAKFTSAGNGWIAMYYPDAGTFRFVDGPVPGDLELDLTSMSVDGLSLSCLEGFLVGFSNLGDIINEPTMIVWTISFEFYEFVEGDQNALEIYVEPN